MVMGKRAWMHGLAAAAALSGLAAGPAFAGVVSVSGNGSGLAGIRPLAEAFMKANPGERVELLPVVGSHGAIKAVLAGELDIGVSGRALTGEERNRGAVEIPFARAPFVFATHPGAGAGGVTLREVIEIYEGRKTRWPDGTPIRLILRPEGESDLDVLRGISNDLAAAVNRAMLREGMIVAVKDAENADAIARTPGSFGALALATAMQEKGRIRVLALDGVVPGQKTLSEGAYPHSKQFFLVTSRSPSPSSKRFLAFIRSREGEAVLNRAGFVPVR